MLLLSLYFTEPEPPEPTPTVPTAEATTSTGTTPSPRPVPWSVLEDERVTIVTRDGLSATGKLLGHDGADAVLALDDGRIARIADDAVDTVLLAERPAAVPPARPIPEPATDTADPSDTADAIAHMVRVEQRIVATRRGAIASGVFGSLSALASTIAEGFNIARWADSEYRCDNDSYGGDDICGWSDDGYTTYGTAGASTPAFLFHMISSPLVLGPTRRLRIETGYREGRGRQIAAWTLWGVGIGSLVTDQAVSWTQFATASYACDEDDGCATYNATRGAPPPFYLISAGLTLSSTILGIVDAQRVIRHAETHRAASARRPSARATFTVFPMQLQRGGGLGLAGRF